ncbi:hypothetical protein K0M31_015744 [Melipona bicolor]|uniref:Uncharacterized protein n=1 Tax=Melipona bicolor TaxID=60889 RepID=A0AA40KF46_9HYME|nr:hypothetical protein K0M31_015744 [Melipona bicolor]
MTCGRIGPNEMTDPASDIRYHSTGGRRNGEYELLDRSSFPSITLTLKSGLIVGLPTYVSLPIMRPSSNKDHASTIFAIPNFALWSQRGAGREQGGESREAGANWEGWNRSGGRTLNTTILYDHPMQRSPARRLCGGDACGGGGGGGVWAEIENVQRKKDGKRRAEGGGRGTTEKSEKERRNSGRHELEGDRFELAFLVSSTGEPPPLPPNVGTIRSTYPRQRP